MNARKVANALQHTVQDLQLVSVRPQWLASDHCCAHWCA